MWTLLLLACAGEGPDADTSVDTDGWVTLYGRVGAPTDNSGLPGIDVVDLARPDARTVTAEDGTWSLLDAPVPHVTLRFTKTGYLPVQIWITPEEAMDPAQPYPMRLGDAATLDGLYAMLGVTREPGRALLLVDAMDPTMSDIFGATVEISSDHDGSWREDASGEWLPENRTNEDRMDLLFLNVAPGPVTLTGVAPDGSPCEQPPGVEIVADEVTHVSVYCTYVQAHDPADTGAQH